MKIYVGNFSSEINVQDLQDLFSIFGEVKSVSIIFDKFTGESRCFGYVTMPNIKQARMAILHLNGKEIKSKKLQVNQARTQSKGHPVERRKKISGSTMS